MSDAFPSGYAHLGCVPLAVRGIMQRLAAARRTCNTSRGVYRRDPQCAGDGRLSARALRGGQRTLRVCPLERGMTIPTVLITGASRGLGAATARITAKLTANVVLMARSASRLEELAGSIRADRGNARVVVGDVSRLVDCQQAVGEAIQAFGRLDAVVNNAGVLVPIAPISEAEPRLWERNLAVNVLGPLMLTQVALPHLRQHSGRVINVSCGAAISVIPGWAAYSASTAALDHLTRVLAEEEPAITAVSFRPGVVDTDMQATVRRDGVHGMPAEAYAHFARIHEEKELLPPEVPGCALAVLALYALPRWTGSALAWNHEELRSLVRQFACGSGSGGPDQEA